MASHWEVAEPKGERTEGAEVRLEVWTELLPEVLDTEGVEVWRKAEVPLIPPPPWNAASRRIDRIRAEQAQKGRESKVAAEIERGFPRYLQSKSSMSSGVKTSECLTHLLWSGLYPLKAAHIPETPPPDLCIQNLVDLPLLIPQDIKHRRWLIVLRAAAFKGVILCELELYNWKDRVKGGVEWREV